MLKKGYCPSSGSPRLRQWVWEPGGSVLPAHSQSPHFNLLGGGCAAAPFRRWEVLRAVEAGDGVALSPHVGVGTRGNPSLPGKARSCCPAAGEKSEARNRERKHAVGSWGTRKRREDLEDVDLDHPEPTVAQFCPVLDLALSSAQKNFVSKQKQCQEVWRRRVIGAFLKLPAMGSLCHGRRPHPATWKALLRHCPALTISLPVSHVLSIKLILLQYGCFPAP
ncbi:uncharacterized protein LOC133076383 [Eubalaena glacialis]|uniref:uncharacterized protein LOC133076383 n=1 Tax=Eubalaena glacialis TaxID=27606 RepID=UPI002A59AEE8|nr:uncharacterized protein LOC133076383 [Eubalaena glacialis]